MARYNTSLESNVVSGATTISSPNFGNFTQLTGTAPYTVVIPDPTLFPGDEQKYYNSTTGTVTVSSPAGIFTGTGGPGTSTYSIPSGGVLNIVSNGTNYIVISEDGSPLIATSGQFSGDVTANGSSATVNLTAGTVNISPTGSGNINNTSIGATNRSSGAFTSLTANQATTLTANIASSSTTTGTLVVTGGIGASGTVSASSIVATNLTGTLQTASQTNITSVGTLSSLTVSGNTGLGGVTSPNGKVHIGLSGTASIATSTISNMTDFALSSRVGFDGLANNNDGIYFGMGINGGISAGIGFMREATGWNSALAFYTNNVTDGVNVSKMQEKVRITSAGYVGVGTPNPQTNLEVVGNAKLRGDLFFASAGAITGTPDNVNYHHIGYAGNTNYHVTGSVTGDMTIGALPGTGITIGTNTSGQPVPVYRIRISPDGTITTSGSTVFNNTSRFFPYPNDGVRWIDTDNSLRTNWQGSASQRTSWGLYWKYTDSQVRSAITYDHVGSEEFQFASGYGPFVFNLKARNGNLADPNEGTELLRLDTEAYGGISIPSTRLNVAGELRTTGNPSRNHFYTFAEGTMNGGYVHLKTNAYQTSYQMYSVLFSGHDYSGAKAIWATLGWYNYAPSNGPISIGGAAGTHSVSAYKSTDGYTVMVIGPTGGYYTAFTLSQFITTQGLADLTITAARSTGSSTGAY